MSKLRKITGYTATAIGAVMLLAIFAMSLPIGGWRALSVQTGSMAPAIQPGALVLVHRVPESELQVGDVITYASKSAAGSTLTHRIVELKKSGSSQQIIVKGDANEVADEPVAPSQVVGEVTKSIPGLGRVSDFVHKPLGLALFVYLPALLIVIYELRLLIRRLTSVEVEKQKKAMQAEHDKKPLSLPDENNLSRDTNPKPVLAVKHHRRVRSLDGLRMVVILACAGMLVQTTHAALNSQATLMGTTISTAPINPTLPVPPPPPTPPPSNTSCNSSSSINISNSSNQTSNSGDASAENNTTEDPAATSGDASNTGNTNTSVVISSEC